MARRSLLLLLAVLAVGALARKKDRTKEWKDFKEKHGKKYHHEDEDKKRYEIFSKKVDKIEEHNEAFKAGKHSFEVKVNKLADWTDEELKNLRGLGSPPEEEQEALRRARAVDEEVAYSVVKRGLPGSIDWRQKGAVTPVKDQLYTCGSCWAFAGSGALESHTFIKTGKLTRLSEQNLVDCTYSSDGCVGGGWYYNAWDYVKRNNGIATESSYPYTGEV